MIVMISKKSMCAWRCCSVAWVCMSLCMLLCQESSSTVRQLIQCHYQSWADHSVPNDLDGVFALITEMRNYIRSSANPVLVHCRYIAVSTCLHTLWHVFRVSYWINSADLDDLEWPWPGGGLSESLTGWVSGVSGVAGGRLLNNGTV